MRAALARGVALVRNDYCIEIWSPAFLEKRSRLSRDPVPLWLGIADMSKHSSEPSSVGAPPTGPVPYLWAFRW
jgi:hypothetical protein